MNKISILNPKAVEQKKQEFQRDGKFGFHVVADFDRTLTKASKGYRSAYELIRAGGYLTPDYPSRSYALYDEYRPLEISEKLSLEEKKAKMVEWWKKHWELMTECGMNIGVIKDIIKKKKVFLRQGAAELLDILAENKIPLLIFSAGLGNFIEEFLKSENKLTNNIHIISNFFKFDKNGKAISYTHPFVHSLNKSEIQLKHHAYQNEILERRNVIVLGDQLKDLDMTNGINHDCMISIGFLNQDVEHLLNEYNRNFDVVILSNGPMNYVNKLIKKIIK